jgi:cob(I)alamin adenosyltransferase
MSHNLGTSPSAPNPAHGHGSGDSGNSEDLCEEARHLALVSCEDAIAAVGVSMSLSIELSGEIVRTLGALQNDLCDVSADLRTSEDAAPRAGEEVRLDPEYVDRVRRLTEHYADALPEAAGRVIPGGTAAGALLHKAQTSIRVAEHHVKAATRRGCEINGHVGDYLGAVAELLAVFARTANAEHGDAIWHPRLSALQAEQAR